MSFTRASVFQRNTATTTQQRADSRDVESPSASDGVIDVCLPASPTMSRASRPGDAARVDLHTLTGPRGPKSSTRRHPAAA